MLMSTSTFSDNLSSDSEAERRRGLRVPQVRPVKMLMPTAARYVPGQTEDVSATGLRLEMPAWAPVLPGHLVSVHVGVATGGSALANRRAMIPCRIVWVDRSSQPDGRVYAGVEFLTSISAQLDAA